MIRTSLALAATLLCAAPARAELVYFTSGHTLSVKSAVVEGTTVVMVLRGGGEMTCDRAVIAQILPDEIPYPEPAPAEAAVAVIPDVAVGADRKPIPVSRAALSADSRFDGLISKAAGQHGVDANLVRAVIQVESAYQPRARSKKGAVGLMQVMPATARQYGVRNLYDPKSNIEVGIRHLKTLLDRFPLNLALAAYNAGQAAVERFGGIPPYRETEAYVARILALVGS